MNKLKRTDGVPDATEYENTPVTGFTSAKALPKKGIEFKAIYEGSHTGGQYNSTSHFLKLTEGEVKVTTKAGEEVVAKAGDKIGMSGNKALNNFLGQVSRNSEIKIVFKGMKTFKNKAGQTASEAQFEVYDLSPASQVKSNRSDAEVDILNG